MRGNYGKLEIHFTSDRRVLNLTSSCIPDADRIQTAISALNVRPRSEETLQKLRAKGLTYADPQGNERTFAIPAASEMTARQMTIYILPSKDQPDASSFILRGKSNLLMHPSNWPMSMPSTARFWPLNSGPRPPTK